MVILPFKSGPVFPGGVFFLSARYFCRTIIYTDQKEGVAVRADLDSFVPGMSARQAEWLHGPG
jgi:hypothetical protein